MEAFVSESLPARSRQTMIGVNSMNRREIVLCDAVRTAIGTFDGGLKAVPATELGAVVVRDALAGAKLKGSDVGTVVIR